MKLGKSALREYSKKAEGMEKVIIIVQAVINK